jgi:N-acyl amino acid synthase of PEP-CTERM/exosortase system
MTSPETLNVHHNCPYFDFTEIKKGNYLQESYALRYQVYCLERSFLKKEDYPSHRETDQFDTSSAHFGALNKNGMLVGSVRLVLAQAKPFPLSEHCQLFDEYKKCLDPSNPDFQKTAEISRLVVSKNYRRRKGDGLYGLSGLNPSEQKKQTQAELKEERRRRPEIVMGLYKNMYQYSKRNGITHWLVAMEKTLFRLLTYSHFCFKEIGPKIDYYGPVRPYYASLDDVERNVIEKNPKLFWEFMEGLEPEYLPYIIKK